MYHRSNSSPFIRPFFPWFLSLCMILIQAPTLFGQEKNGSSRVTLVSKSTGLENPSKEEGNTEVELADLNQDGHLDIVSVGDHGSPYVNSNQHGIMVWLGNGAGTWTVHQLGNFGYGGCAAGDLNNDGMMDLAWGVHHDWGSGGFGDKLMGAALGNGSGISWTPWDTGLASNGETYGMFATALADFDLNGRLDVVSQSFGGGNGLRLYENHGDGTWTQAWALTSGSVGYTVETCDVNADGYPDIVSTRSGSYVLLGDGAFGFTINMAGLPSGTIIGIDAGDMNGDGCDDIVFTLDYSGIRCYAYQKGSNSWLSTSSGLPVSGYFSRTQFGDFNGDGRLDIVAYSKPKGYVFLNNGNGTWRPDAEWTMPSPGKGSALRADGDTDHDGREDITVLATKSGFPFHRNQLRVYSPWLEPVELGARVTRPNGGETFVNGSLREIRWLAAVPPGQGQASIEIRLSENGIAGPFETIASNLPDNGCFSWRVNAGASSTCRIEVIATTTSATQAAVSAADFTITEESLRADADTIAESSGGTVTLSLNAGAIHANRNYIILGSVTGISPGTPLPGGKATLPLNWDLFTQLVITLMNGPVMADFTGSLNSAGKASAIFDTLGPLPPGSAGMTLAFAYALNPPWNFASNPITIEIIP